MKANRIKRSRSENQEIRVRWFLYSSQVCFVESNTNYKGYLLALEHSRGRHRTELFKMACLVSGRLPKVCCPQYTLTLSQQVPATTTTARTFPQNNRNGAFSKLPSAERGECGVNAFDSSKRIVGGTPSEKG